MQYAYLQVFTHHVWLCRILYNTYLTNTCINTYGIRVLSHVSAVFRNYDLPVVCQWYERTHPIKLCHSHRLMLEEEREEDDAGGVHGMGVGTTKGSKATRAGAYDA